MKYLISSDGNSASSPVSSHFGKAPYFLIYDDENESTAAIANGDDVDPHLVAARLLNNVANACDGSFLRRGYA